MNVVSPSTISRLRRLMQGSALEKDLAEGQLKDCDPCTLPPDILDPWLQGSSYDKFRAGRIKEAWNQLQNSNL